MKNQSNFLRLNLNDVLKSLLIALLSSFLVALYPVFQSGNFPSYENLKIAIIAAVSNAISYLLKNVLTNSNNEFLKKEKK